MEYSSEEFYHVIECHRRHLVSFVTVIIFCILLCLIVDNLNNTILNDILLFLFIFPNIYLGINTYKLCIAMKYSRLVSLINVFCMLSIFSIPFYLFSFRPFFIFNSSNPFFYIIFFTNYYLMLLFLGAWVKVLQPYFLFSENGLNFWGKPKKKKNNNKPTLNLNFSNEDLIQLKHDYQKWNRQNNIYKFIVFMYCIIINNICLYNIVFMFNISKKITSKLLDKELALQLIFQKAYKFINYSRIGSIFIIYIFIMGITISIKNRKTYYLLNKGERTKGFSISIIIYFISIFTLLFLHKDLWVEVTNNITIDNYSSAMSTCTASFVYSLLYSIILMCVGTPSFYIYKEKVRKILSQFDNNTSES